MHDEKNGEYLISERIRINLLKFTYFDKFYENSFGHVFLVIMISTAYWCNMWYLLRIKYYI